MACTALSEPPLLQVPHSLQLIHPFLAMIMMMMDNDNSLDNLEGAVDKSPCDGLC